METPRERHVDTEHHVRISRTAATVRRSKPPARRNKPDSDARRTLAGLRAPFFEVAHQVIHVSGEHGAQGHGSFRPTSL